MLISNSHESCTQSLSIQTVYVCMYVCMCVYIGAIAFDGSYDDFVQSSEFVSISTTEGNQQSDSEIDEGTTSSWNKVAYCICLYT